MTIIYFISVISVTLFYKNPIIIIISLAGGVSFCLLHQNITKFFDDVSFYISFALLISVSIPLFSHNGKTPLFFLNDNPITFEAIIYGIFCSLMIISVIYWYKCSCEIFTSDKILCLMRFAPKTAILISILFHFFPILKKHYKDTDNAQKSVGMFSGRSVTDKLFNKLKVLSAMLGWSLEYFFELKPIMECKGYKIKGRTSFTPIKFNIRDIYFAAADILLVSAFIYISISHEIRYEYYPETTQINLSAESLFAYGIFGLMTFLPFIIEVKENIKWKLSQSKI